MKKNKKMEHGHLAGAMESMPPFKEGKPKLNISARMDSYPSFEVDDGYQKKERERVKKEIKAITDQLDGWDAEDVSTRALKSLKTELAMKKARLMEIEARLDIDEGSESDEEKA